MDIPGIILNTELWEYLLTFVLSLLGVKVKGFLNISCSSASALRASGKRDAGVGFLTNTLWIQILGKGISGLHF